MAVRAVRIGGLLLAAALLVAAVAAPDAVFCPVCGASNRPNSKFCLKDGSPIPAYEPVRQPTSFVRSSATYSDEEIQEMLHQAANSVVRLRARTTSTYKFPVAWWKDYESEYYGRAMLGKIETSNIDQRLAGSGFVINDDGEIVTNAHVASPDGMQAEITAESQDGKTLPVKVIGVDRASDLALIKVEPGVLPPLQWGDSGTVRVGQQAWAIGNPLDIGISFTRGTMSGVSAVRIGLHQVESFLHSDAKITHGNSGGPLVGATGRVLGVNSAGFEGKGQGYPIPSAMARIVVDRLRREGGYDRGFLGLQVKPIDSDAINSYGLTRREGVVVEWVLPGTPAEKIGIKQGDVLLGINGRRAPTAYLLQEAISSVGPGAPLTLQGDRQGKELAVQITTARRPEYPRGDPLLQMEAYLRIYFEEDIKQRIVLIRDPNRSRRAPGLFAGARVKTVLPAQDWPEEPITLNYYKTRAKPTPISSLQDLRTALSRAYLGGRMAATFEIDYPSQPITSVAFDEMWPIFI